MEVFILMGPPGVGKGTQAGLLASRLGVEHVSTGTLLRSEIASGSELGKRIKETVESGSLVGDELILSCLESKLRSVSSDKKWLLLDGIPRTVAQIGGLDATLAKQGLRVGKVAALVAPLDELVDRFSKRWTCKVCGDVAAFSDSSVALQTACRKCGTNSSYARRPDDEPVAVRRRFEIYHAETAPVIEAYKSRKVLFEVNGLRGIEPVYLDVASGLLNG